MRCDACGLCEQVCGRGFFELKEGACRYVPTQDCIACGHCMAVCPRDALLLQDGTLPPKVEPSSLPIAESLLHLFRARRSSRRFKPDLPDRALLDRLLEAARFAPTGTNRQAVRIVLLTEPRRTALLRERIMARYGEYERHLANPLKRFFLKTFVDRRLGDPAIRRFLGAFMDRWRSGADPLFHNAPVIAFLYSGEEASTPKDDCCLALYHMVLMAERLGLGSCLLGTAEAALAKTRVLNDLLEIPRSRPVLACACFGFPRIRFRRTTERKEIPVKWL